jgi:hypothetical protein
MESGVLGKALQFEKGATIKSFVLGNYRVVESENNSALSLLLQNNKDFICK